MRIINILLTILLFVVSARPQEPRVLTLESSMSIAFGNNPELQMAEKEYKKQKAGVWEAYSGILPSLNGNVNFQHAWDIQETTIPNFIKQMLGPQAPAGMPDYVRISFGLENTFTYGATLTQPLFLGGAGIAGVNIAYAAKRAAEKNYSSIRQQLIYDVSDAFYGCLLTEELTKVTQKALEQAEANFDMVDKKYKAGTASGFDQMRAKVEVANLKPELISARNNHQLSLTRLRNVLGLQKDVDFIIQGALMYEQDPFGSMPLDTLQNMALKNRPEMHALLEQKYISKKSITIARSNFLPKLFFQTDYSKMAMRNDYKFTGEDFSKGFTSAVSLQIPLFNGFKNLKQYQKSQLDYRIMLDTEKQVRDGILAEVEVAYNKFSEAKEKYLAAAESVGLAEESLRLATLMYEEGASTQLDVLNAQLALNRARVNYASSVYEHQMARYQLRKVTGNLKEIL